MKKFEATIVLVVGHQRDEENTPILKYQKFEVEADNEEDAINKAKLLETSLYSVWESYADEID